MTIQPIISIKFYEQINNTPAIPILIDANKFLLDNRLAEPLTLINWDQSAFVAFANRTEEAETIGVLSFEKSKWQKRIYIAIGYVDPKWRKSGIYNQLWQKLVEYAQKEEFKQIASVTHVNNTLMREVASRQGRKEISINISFDVPPPKEGL